MQQRQEVSLAALDQYLQEVRWISPLTRDEESSLLSCIEWGKNVQQARDRLIQGYQPLMIGLAKRFARYCRDMDFLDLVQEGNAAFLQGIEKYDVRKQESSFGTFIFSWVRVAMLTALWRYQGSIRLPLHKVRAIKRMKVINDELLLLLGREPTIAETASAMGITEWQARECTALQEQRVVSLDMLVDENEDMTIGEMIEDTTGNTLLGEEGSSLEEMLQCLTEQERSVVFARYGLGDHRFHTQQEVAQLLGMRLYKVRELDRRARIRLRRMLEYSTSCTQLKAS
jgi:RNA polymerase sigma factor (sigma-70 family)